MRRVFFQHLMKTGGTSVVAMLENFFPHNLSCEYGRFRGDHAQLYVRAGRSTFVHDHSHIMHLRTKGSFAFTFLREPFSRLLSGRRQWTDAAEIDIDQMNAPSATAVSALRSLDLDRILDLVFDYPVTVPWFWNHQAISLGLRPLEFSIFQNRNPKRLYSFFPYAKLYRQWLERNRSNILREALANLRSFDYVGIFEDFDDSVRELFWRLGLPEPETTLHLNPRAAYPDELAARLKEKAAPFLDLDYELYHEGRELRARAGRAVRGPPADFIGRSVSASDDKDFGAEQSPGGHGWHPATMRGDRIYSRWTGPGRRSVFCLHMGAGNYRMEIWLYGAVSEAAVYDVAVSVNGEAVDVEIQVADEGHYVLICPVLRDKGGRVEVVIEAGETIRNYGMELERIHIVGAGSVSFPLDPHRWHARVHGLPEPTAFDVSGRSVAPHEAKTFSMEEQPGGEGWRRANIRQDGCYSRWTGPGEDSVFSIFVAAGSYRIELRLCGAVTPRVLMGISLLIDGQPLNVHVTAADKGRFLCTTECRIVSGGPKEIVIRVPETVKGYGIEAESLAFIGLA